MINVYTPDYNINGHNIMELLWKGVLKTSPLQLFNEKYSMKNSQRKMGGQILIVRESSLFATYYSLDCCQGSFVCFLCGLGGV